MVKVGLTEDGEMRSLLVPNDCFCFEAAGLRLSVCPARSGADLQERGGELAVHEARTGLPDGETKIIAMIDHPRALLQLASFCDASPRLIAMAWDEAALMQTLHAEQTSDTMRHARSLIIMAAHAASIRALDSLAPLSSEKELRRACEEARRNGFDGKLAATSTQLAIIEDAFA
jgi:citrate lyase subunit beta/citryl-CoA lyase